MTHRIDIRSLLYQRFAWHPGDVTISRLEKRFNPDQPRDSHGRFAGDGGGDEATAAAPQGPQFQVSPAAAAEQPIERPAYAPPEGGDEPTEAPAAVGAHQGGSYRTLKANVGPGMEINHMPAYEASPLRPENGPAIVMSKEDHFQTASYGNKQAAKDYRAAQRALISQGRFREAQMMDIEDIQAKFGGKYDGAIRQMLKYTDKLTFSAKHGMPLNPTPKQIRGGGY